MSDSDKSTDERKVDEFDSHDIRRSEDAASVGWLLEIMARLRDPDTGCPWDIEQTFQTIAPYTIEEAYEVADAIQQDDMSGLQGELGDLMLQVVYHSQMASELGHFTFAEVVRSVCDKMVSRHPHVFGNESRDKTADEQTRDWENVKAAERASSGTGRKSVLAGIARNLPAPGAGKKAAGPRSPCRVRLARRHPCAGQAVRGSIRTHRGSRDACPRRRRVRRSAVFADRVGPPSRYRRGNRAALGQFEIHPPIRGGGIGNGGSRSIDG